MELDGPALRHGNVEPGPHFEMKRRGHDWCAPASPCPRTKGGGGAKLALPILPAPHYIPPHGGGRFHDHALQARNVRAMNRHS